MGPRRSPITRRPSNKMGAHKMGEAAAQQERGRRQPSGHATTRPKSALRLFCAMLSHCCCCWLLIATVPGALCSQQKSAAAAAAEVCAVHSDANRPSIGRMSCPSIGALKAFNGAQQSIGDLRLWCGEGAPSHEKVQSALHRLQSAPEFAQLRNLSVLECGALAVQFAALPQLDTLSLAGAPAIRQLDWRTIGSTHLRLLNVTSVECARCANAWMAERADSHSTHLIFPTLPQQVHFPANCTFAHCPRDEAVLLDQAVVHSRLGAALNLRCAFQTRNAMDKGENNRTTIFAWPWNEESGESSGEWTERVENNNAAALHVRALRPRHLGYVTCRCWHCDAPRFAIAQVRFNTPISAHIRPAGASPSEVELVVHGYPLDQTLRLTIRRLADNHTHTVNFTADQSTTTVLLFNDSQLVRAELAQTQFFLRYFTVAIHECSECAHAHDGGQFEIAVCRVGAANNDSATAPTSCAQPLLFQLGPGRHQVNRGAQREAAHWWAYLPRFLFSLLLVMLSATILALGARTVLRLRQRMELKEKLKRRRRMSRNTQRTEETSIPLDSLSRTLSLSNYTSQHNVPLVDARDLQLGERIGKGAFGEVFAAEWTPSHSGGGISASGTVEERLSMAESLPTAEDDSKPCEEEQPQQRRVAVKMLTGVQMDAEMDREAALLARLEHPNVLRMFGVAHVGGQVALVLEMMNLGDMRNYIRNRAPRCDNYSQFPPALLRTELVSLCIQIAEGLCYLVQQQIVHRDLAARNCLVAGDSDMRCCSAAFRPSVCVKISDFGMSRRLYSSIDYYKMGNKGRTALPVRWMPPECLNSGKYTHQSDMWSFGVLLFEVFSFGEMPFGVLSNGEVLAAVLGGMRPEVPDKCAPELADLMRQCWHRSAPKRINAEEALLRLRLIQQSGLSSDGNTRH